MSKNIFDEVPEGSPEKERFIANASPAGLTNTQLLQMLIDAQRETAEANRKLSDALLESRKPWVDPKVLEAKQRELDERRKQVANELRAREWTKRTCTHRRESNQTLNIKWMRHSNGIILGVCGQCFSQFDARVPADAELLRADLKSQKNMGQAGQHAVRGAVFE